jgi:hypothetical protein
MELAEETRSTRCSMLMMIAKLKATLVVMEVRMVLATTMRRLMGLKTMAELGSWHLVTGSIDLG